MPPDVQPKPIERLNNDLSDETIDLMKRGVYSLKLKALGKLLSKR
jgi:hypothetical protein